MNPESQRWADVLAKALRSWLEKERYKYASKFFSETKINEALGKHIINADSITRPEIYAVLFHRTGLKQADPRTIPPRPRVTRGKTLMETRAWSEKQWQDWLKKKAVPTPAKNTAPLRGTPRRQQKPDTQSAISQGLLDAVLTRLGEQIAREVKTQLSGPLVDDIVNEVAQAVQRSIQGARISGTEDQSVQEHIQAIRSALQEAVTDEAKFAAFATENRTTLVQLLPWLDALSQPDNAQRIAALRRIQEINL